MADATKNFGRGVRDNLKKSFSDGMSEGKKAFGDLGKDVKGLIGDAVTLGGAFSVGKGIHDAVTLNETFRQLSHQIRDTTGVAATWEDVQKRLEDAALDTGQATEKMAEAYKGMIDATGDVDFADAAINQVGKFATATRRDANTIAGVAATMKEKFGASAEEIPAMLADLQSQTSKGGPTFDDMAGRLSQVGAIAMNAGMKGAEGMRFMMGALNETDDAMGGFENQVAGLKAILTGLRNTGKLDALAKSLDPAHAKKFAKELHGAKSSIDAMGMILGKKGGFDALTKMFGKSTESQIALRIITQPFNDATKEVLSNTKASEAEKKAAIQKGVVEFDKFVKGLGKGDIDANAITERFDDAMQSPAKNLQTALTKLEKAFGNPKMLEAVDKLADKLPDLASALADLTAWAVDNPWKAAAAGVGLKVGGAVLPGVAASAAGGLLKAGGQAAAGAGAAALITKGGLLGRVGGLLGGLAGGSGGGAAAAGAAQGLSALSGGTAAASGTAGATGLAALGGKVAAAGAAGTAAVGVVAAGAVAAAVYNGYKLLQETKDRGSGGFFSQLADAWKGPAKAVSGADYDRVMANVPGGGGGPKKLEEPKTAAVAQLTEATTKAAAATTKGTKKTEDAAIALASLATSARSLDGYLRTLGGGASHGPAGLGGSPVPGASPLPPNR